MRQLAWNLTRQGDVLEARFQLRVLCTTARFPARFFFYFLPKKGVEIVLKAGELLLAGMKNSSFSQQ